MRYAITSHLVEIKKCVSLQFSAQVFHATIQIATSHVMTAIPSREKALTLL